MADELIEPSLLCGKEPLDDNITSLKDFLHSNSGTPKEDYSQHIHPTYRFNAKMTLSRD